jgi:deoxyribonuclease IV
LNIGCHVSIAGGIQNAPKNGHDLGCEVIQIFTRPPQGGPASILTDEICDKFKVQSAKCKIKKAYIHTPYYINLASANNRIRYGSIKAIRDELERGSLLGAKYVMTHLGTAKDLGQKEAMKKTIEMLKKTLDGYSGSTKLLLENSAGAGEIIGDDLKELARIILETNSSDIAGICLDTQHSFASGYDWRNFVETLKRIEDEIGLETIKLIHANDSQSECGSNRDRHEHIGQGKIGHEAFKEIVNFARSRDIDMICETEYPGVENDIQFLKSLRGK